jgi:hypothetical protein
MRIGASYYQQMQVERFHYCLEKALLLGRLFA